MNEMLCTTSDPMQDSALHGGENEVRSMIELTHVDGTHFFVNVAFIEFVESTPDTIVSLIDHKKLRVQETSQDIIARLFEFHQQFGEQSAIRVVSLMQEHERMAQQMPEQKLHHLPFTETWTR
jgi:flagellar protein FlbD